MADRNYLIGRGERLVSPVGIPSGPLEKKHPYSFDDVRRHTLPQWRSVVADISTLPDLACPQDEAVFSLVLHPTYLAMSYFPKNFLNVSLLRSVGSRAAKVVPRGTTRKTVTNQPQLAPELFIAGDRDAISKMVRELPNWNPTEQVRTEFAEIERVNPLDLSRSKVRSAASRTEIALEVGLHLDPGNNSILEGFRAYLKSLDLKANFDQMFQVAGLCFMPLVAPAALASEIAKFSFLRVIREMPKLSLNASIVRTVASKNAPVTLPDLPPLDSELRVATFDGGLPAGHKLDRWVTAHDAPGVGRATEEFMQHGLAVTSALLFGPLRPNEVAPQPVCHIDHWRVLDEKDGVEEDDRTNLFGVLHRIKSVLDSSNYPAVSLTLGPSIPVEDDEVHVWTSVLDQYLSDGQTLLTAAVGNDGEADEQLGLNRVQPPSDAVNALAVGACNSRNRDWKRAEYSCKGAGRQPGAIKPDVVAFGGSDDIPYNVLAPEKGNQPAVRGTSGTSVAGPTVLRSGMAIRAHFGPDISAMALKALLIHHADANGNDVREVGWGLVPEDLNDLVVCGAGEAHVLFQGKLSPGSGMRMPIPMPSDALPGMVTIRSTICYATEVDPHHPLAYTQAGLLPTFRPNTVDPPEPGKSYHPTKAFFKTADYWASEAELRLGSHKWENVLRKEQRFQGKTLRDPVFDLHHFSRDNGRSAPRSAHVHYAAVVTVKIPKLPDVYNGILRRYRTQLEVLRPRHEIPVRAGRPGR